MIDIKFDLNRIDPSFYDTIDHSEVEITETADDGKARLTLCFQANNSKKFIRLLKERNDNWLTYIKHKKCADGIIIQYDPNCCTHANVYIVELKKKINGRKWTGRVKEQFKGATLRALSFLSTAGITHIEKLEYITGYVESDMDNTIQAIKNKPNIHSGSPISKKVLPGIKETEILEWEKDEIEIFHSTFTHHKVQLTLDREDIGIGQLDISH